MDDQELMKIAEAFVKTNLIEMCDELTQLSNTGIRPKGKINDLVLNYLEPIPVYQRYSVADRMVEYEALQYVASLKEEKSKDAPVDVNKELLDALELINSESLQNSFIYDVREREGEGWDGPKCVAAGKAINIIVKLLKDHGRG